MSANNRRKVISIHGLLRLRRLDVHCELHVHRSTRFAEKKNNLFLQDLFPFTFFLPARRLFSSNCMQITCHLNALSYSKSKQRKGTVIITILHWGHMFGPLNFPKTMEFWIVYSVGFPPRLAPPSSPTSMLLVGVSERPVKILSDPILTVERILWRTTMLIFINAVVGIVSQHKSAGPKTKHRWNYRAQDCHR